MTMEQALILLGIGVVLVVLLLILKAILKLTKTCLGLGCLGILVVLVLAFVVMQGLPTS